MSALVAAVWARVPAWLKIALIGTLAVGAAYSLGLWRGADLAKDAIKMAAIKEATSRISKMENSNADFRRKSPRDRCLVLMRDSELPDSGCD